jgi:hypothetical protein
MPVEALTTPHNHSLQQKFSTELSKNGRKEAMHEQFASTTNLGTATPQEEEEAAHSSFKTGPS